MKLVVELDLDQLTLVSEIPEHLQEMANVVARQMGAAHTPIKVLQAKLFEEKDVETLFEGVTHADETVGLRVSFVAAPFETNSVIDDAVVMMNSDMERLQ